MHKIVLFAVVVALLSFFSLPVLHDALGQTPPATAAPTQSVTSQPAQSPAPQAPGAGHGFLIDKHLAAGLDCNSCHTETPPAKAADMSACTNCHGAYDKLAQLTAADTPNPHAPSHLGEIPCAECHHVHMASQSLCDQCHSYGMTVP